MSDKQIFEETFRYFQTQYNGLEMEGTLVVYNGERKFNTDGFNLLYNLSRLCELIKEELI